MLATMSAPGLSSVRVKAPINQRFQGAPLRPGAKRAQIRRETRIAARAEQQSSRASDSVDISLPLAAGTVSIALLLLLPDAALAAAASESSQHPHSPELWSIAADEDFWMNMQRYLRFTVSTAAGMAYMVARPFYDLIKKPTTAIPLLIGLFLAYKGLIWTLNSMLGIEDAPPLF